MIHWRVITPLLMIALLQGCAGSTSPVQQSGAVPAAASAPATKSASEPVVQAKKPNVTVEVTKTLPGRRPEANMAAAEQVGTWVYIKLTNAGNAPSMDRLTVSCEGKASTGAVKPQGGAALDGTLNPGASAVKIFWMQGASLAPKDINCSIAGLAARDQK